MGRETKSRSKSVKSGKSATTAKSVKSITKPTQGKPATLDEPKRKHFFTRKSLCNPFLNYMRDFRKEMKNHNSVTARQLVSMGAQRWRQMNPADRAMYIKEAEAARKKRKKDVITKKGGGVKGPEIKKYGNNVCPKCGHRLYEEPKELSRDPSTTATTVTTRTSRSPSESAEDVSEVTESCSAGDSMSSLD